MLLCCVSTTSLPLAANISLWGFSVKKTSPLAWTKPGIIGLLQNGHVIAVLLKTPVASRTGYCYIHNCECENECKDAAKESFWSHHFSPLISQMPSARTIKLTKTLTHAISASPAVAFSSTWAMSGIRIRSVLLTTAPAQMEKQKAQNACRKTDRTAEGDVCRFHRCIPAKSTETIRIERSGLSSVVSKNTFFSRNQR